MPNQLEAASARNLQDVINQARVHLYANHSPLLNRLNGALDNVSTSFSVHYAVAPLGVLKGAIIAIDLEEIRVWEAAGTNITVCDRGVNGTIPATHTDGTVVELQPRFSQYQIATAVNDELDDLCSPVNGLFQVPLSDWQVTYNPAVSGYDLPMQSWSNNNGLTQGTGPLVGIQEIRYDIPGPTRHMPAVRRFDMDLDVAPVAVGGIGTTTTQVARLLLYESAFPGLPLHVKVRLGFPHFQNLADTLLQIGLPPGAGPILPIGAAIRLMAGREIKRNFTESTPDPLQLELVLAGNVLNSYKGLQLLRQSLIVDVKTQLLRWYKTPLRVLN